VIGRRPRPTTGGPRTDHANLVSRRRRIAGPAATGAVVTTLALAATALAGGVTAGTYSGTLAPPRTAYLVTLTTHRSTLKRATLSNIPIYCSGGGPAIPVRFGTAKISSRGAFTAHGIYRIAVGPRKGKIGDRLTLSGRFSSHGTVSGTLHTVVVGIQGCSGTSRFSAKR
jgi:hypothetical protein